MKMSMYVDKLNDEVRIIRNGKKLLDVDKKLINCDGRSENTNIPLFNCIVKWDLLEYAIDDAIYDEGKSIEKKTKGFGSVDYLWTYSSTMLKDAIKEVERKVNHLKELIEARKELLGI